MRFISTVIIVPFVLFGCAQEPYVGPDKQFAGSLQGAVTGAGSGAVTGLQVGAGSGPGAAVGAGLGAVAGGLQGLVKDQNEEQLLKLAAQTRVEREAAFAQEMLAEHVKRKQALHPTRDIFPADWFFYGDEAQLRPEALPLVRELAHLNKKRLPWSRLVVAVYVKAADRDSAFAKHLAENRSRSICDHLIRDGLEPRRVLTRAVVINEPVVLDPHDRPDRYNQAVEIIPLDR